MNVTLYHNPRCSTSRKTLALLRERGIEPTVVEYLKNPPTAVELADLVARLGIPASGLLRKKEAAYAESGLAGSSLDDATVIAAMAAHPILIERPIVLAHGKAALGRPPENVLAILEGP